MGCKIYFDILSLIASCQLTLICSNIDSAIYRTNDDPADKYEKKINGARLRWIEIHPVGSVIHLFNNWVLVLIVVLMLDLLTKQSTS